MSTTSSSGSARSGIIGLLEVCEADFKKGLTEMNTAEQTAQATYEQESKENEIEKTTMEQDVKYKPKESDGLDKSNAELTSEKGNVETELAALNYAERKARREALKVLNEYYAKADKAHSSSDGASSGINQITWLSCSARISMFLGPDDIDGYGYRCIHVPAKTLARHSSTAWRTSRCMP